jgi:hypothetical protein
MGALSSAIDLAFKISAEGGAIARAEVEKTVAVIKGTSTEVAKTNKSNSVEAAKNIDNVAASSTKGGGALAMLGAGASAAAASVVAVAAAAAGAVVGLTLLASAAGKSGQEIYKLQQQTGLSAESITALRLAALEANVDIGSLDGILQDFTQTVLLAANGSTEAKEKLEALGLDPQKAVKDLDGALAKVLKTINDAPNPLKAAELAAAATGESIGDLQRLAKAAQGDLAELTKRAKELGVTLDNDAARKADEFSKDMALVSMQVRAQAYVFAREYMPQISAALRSVGQFIADNRETFVWWGKTIAWWIAEGVKNFTRLASFAKSTATAVSAAFEWIGYSVAASMARAIPAVGGLISSLLQVLDLIEKTTFTNVKVEGFDASQFLPGMGNNPSPRPVLNKVPTATVARGGNVGRGTGSGGGGRQETEAERAEREGQEALDAQEKVDAIALRAKQDALAELSAADKKDLAERKISKEIYDALQRTNEAELTAFELAQLEERQKIAKLTADQKKAVGEEIKTLQSQMRVAELENTAETIAINQEEQDKIREAHQKTADFIASLKEKRIESEEKLTAFRLEQERKILANEVTIAQEQVKWARSKQERTKAEADLLTALIVLRQFDLAELEKARLAADAKAKKEAADAIARLETEKATEQQIADAKVEIDKRLKNQLLQNEEDFKNQKKIVIENFDAGAAVPVEGTEENDPFAWLTKERVGVQEALLGQLEKSFNMVADAVGNAVESYILYGKSGASVRQVAAQVIASLAKMAAVEAVWNLAKGFAALARSWFDPTAPAQAALHFKSAAIFGGIAIGAAIAGRGVAGDSFGGGGQNQAYDFRANTVDSNNSSRAAGNTTQMLSESRTMRQDQRITLEVQSRDSHIVRVVGDNLNQRGDLAPIVVKFVEQN